mgnify:CR=1 FL=1
MIKLGKYNELEIAREVEFGIYVTDGEGVDILMPQKYVPANAKVGDKIRCFVYQDSEARLIATTEHPYAQVGEFASLLINSVNQVGAFADWGTSKELLIPHREQPKEMEEGRRYIVYIYVDEVSGRIVGTARVDKYLDNVPAPYEKNEEVDILVWKPTPLGYKVIINNKGECGCAHTQVFTESFDVGFTATTTNAVTLNPGATSVIQPAQLTCCKAEAVKVSTTLAISIA